MNDCFFFHEIAFLLCLDGVLYFDLLSIDLYFSEQAFPAYTKSRHILAVGCPIGKISEYTVRFHLDVDAIGNCYDNKNKNLPRPRKFSVFIFFSFLPHKVIVDRLTAVNKNVLTRTEFVRYRQEICPVCNFLGSRPTLEWRFSHNLSPELGIVHHTLI